MDGVQQSQPGSGVVPHGFKVFLGLEVLGGAGNSEAWDVFKGGYS